MSSNKYDVFLKVVDLGSFSRAARELGYTQSTVSQSVIQMETAFGFKLMDRNKKGLNLTPEGEALLPLIREASESERRIEEKVAELSGVLKGRVFVGAYHSISNRWMPRILENFKELYPEVTIDHIYGNSDILHELLEFGRLDCCLMDILPGESFETHFLHRDSYKVLLPMDHPLSQSETFPLSELDPAGVDYVLKGRGQCLFRKGSEEEVSYFTTDDSVMVMMVEQGLGIGLISDLSLSYRSADVVVKDTDVPLTRDLGILVKNEKNLSPAARTFIRHLRKNDYYLKEK
ncbi:MAG: LysR family transcriptional regulator [Firmicutes bacterium]|nr:LysR family transcriptional regulator [Bacillota bacterium]